jgi:hypothetical protein
LVLPFVVAYAAPFVSGCPFTVFSAGLAPVARFAVPAFGARSLVIRSRCPT